MDSQRWADTAHIPDVRELICLGAAGRLVARGGYSGIIAMWKRWVVVIVLGILAACNRAAPTSSGPIDIVNDNANTPEGAYRRFMLANLAGQEKEIRPLIVDHENADILWRDAAYPKDVAAALAEQYRQMEITRVKLPSQDETPDRVLLGSSASPIPLAVVRIEGVWRVDASPIIEFRKAARKTP